MLSVRCSTSTRTIFFYDLTSTYFEGQAQNNPSAKRGYSRDKRPDCKQVVVGLVINRDGFPLAHEIFDGNTQDRASLPSMLDALEARVGGFRRGQMVVVDRGMAFEENLEQLRTRGLHYLVASRQGERTRWLAEFETLEGFDEVIREPSPRNPRQKKTKVEVKLKRTEDETFVLCISDGRKQKDRAIRDKHERRLLEDLDKLHARIGAGRLVGALKIGEAIGRLKERYPRVARYYDIAFDPDAQTLRYSLNEPRRELAERLDGSYVLKSDRTDLGAEEAWRIYHLLTRAENAFRCMKSPLAERPIFHQVQRRVETHIFLCVLAYHLLVAIEKTLLGPGRAHFLVECARCTGDSRHRHHRASDRFWCDDAHPQGLHGGIQAPRTLSIARRRRENHVAEDDLERNSQPRIVTKKSLTD